MTTLKKCSIEQLFYMGGTLMSHGSLDSFKFSNFFICKKNLYTNKTIIFNISIFNF